jgi:hypothetical protein
VKGSCLILAILIVSCNPRPIEEDPEVEESQDPAKAKDASPSEGEPEGDPVLALLDKSDWEWTCDSEDSADTSSRLIFESGKLVVDAPTVWGRQCDYDPSNDYEASGRMNADAVRAEFTYTVEKIGDLKDTYRLMLVLVKTERAFLTSFNAGTMNQPRTGGDYGFNDWVAGDWKQINGLDQYGATKEQGSTDYAYEVGEKFVAYAAVVKGKLYLEGMPADVYDLITSLSRSEDVDPWAREPGKREKFWDNEAYRREFLAKP